jgi:hypothetical protein
MDWARPEGAAPLPDIAALPTLWSEARTPPEAAPPGRLWASAARDGALLGDGAGWRWIARHAFDRVVVGGLLPTPVAIGHDEPLLSSGDAAQADVVSVRKADPGHFSFAYGRWPGARATRGNAIAVPPGPIPMEIVLDRAEGRVGVTLGGRSVLDARADLLPIEHAGLFVGRLPRGLAR